jgi:hypothetical protein
MRLSSLLAAEVRTEEGKGLGHVHDVRVRRLGRRSPEGYGLRVVGLVVGSRGIRERIGLDTARSDAAVVDRELIAWDRVVEIDGDEGLITVREA